MRRGISLICATLLFTGGQAAVQAHSGTISRAGVSLEWSSSGAVMHIGGANGTIRWQTHEPVYTEPEYLASLKLFLVITKEDDSQFHIWGVGTVGKLLTRIDVPSVSSGALAAIAAGASVAFANPALFARAPIVGEKNSSWLAARQQWDVYAYDLQTGNERWHQSELAVGQPIAGSGSFFWTVRLVNPMQAYDGAKPKYEIDQVGSYSGLVTRAWPYPGDGGDLTAYRWRAEVRGVDCTLKRSEPWPDSEVQGNHSPVAILLRKIAPGKLGKKLRKKKVGA